MVLQSLSYTFDEEHISNALENSVQLIAAPKALGSLFVQSDSNCVVLVLDWAGVGGGPVRKGMLYPILVAAPLNDGWFSNSWHGGVDFKYGIWMGAYSTLALALAALAAAQAGPAAPTAPDLGNVLFIEAYWRKGRFSNLAAAQDLG